MEYIDMIPKSFRDGVAVFETFFTCTKGGRYGFTVRLFPSHEDLAHNMLPGLIKWVE
jgi:hypothetical protein